MLKKILGNKKMLADIILIGVLLIVSLSVFLIISLTKEEGAVAVVTVDGVVVSEYSLAVDGEYSLNGGTNTLVIKNGEAYVTYASCPDGLCVGQGKISMVGERIVCLPNRVMIEIVGEGEELI
ncbi:MAG: NusG domain II-containing protein [Clostridia bacterium]|nr:NusG domain II-containing protein [Clostridia bacterium]